MGGKHNNTLVPIYDLADTKQWTHAAVPDNAAAALFDAHLDNQATEEGPHLYHPLKFSISKADCFSVWNIWLCWNDCFGGSSPSILNWKLLHYHPEAC